MRILMITIGYPPRQVGGTEVYVFGLVEALKEQGHNCDVAYLEPFEEESGPESRLAVTEHLGTTVYAVQINTSYHKLEHIVFDAGLRNILIDEFREVVRELRPDVIHVHPLQLGFDSYLMEDLNRSGEKVIMTFHSSTTTCARGDLIYMGKQVCDGLVMQDRCTKCLYQWRSVPGPVAAGLSRLPLKWFAAAFARLEGKPSLKKLRSFVSLPLMIDERRQAWTRTTINARAIVAVCDWVREITIKNGVSPEKVFSSRHGLRLGGERNGDQRSGATRFGYLGRISPEKGIEPLLKVLERMPPKLEYEFEFCSSSFAAANRRIEEESLIQAIHRLARRDPRIKILDNIPDQQLREVMARWDALVVPSLWLESGPQVVYEAFAVHTPVIGSRLGGIAELVRHGETGYLFTPGNFGELRSLLVQNATEPADLRGLRKNIGPVRTTAQVAEDMLRLYRQTLSAGPLTATLAQPVEAVV